MMKAITLLGAALTALTALGQAPEPSPTPLAVVYEKLPGVEVRFVNYRWRPEIFEPMVTGAEGPPESKRAWAFGRIVNKEPLRIGKRILPIGHCLLVFNPNLDGKGMTLEARHIDMRDIDMNVLQVPPPGETYATVPLKFETSTEADPRMVMTLSESSGGKITLHFRYGNRRFTWDFSRL